MYFSHSYKKQNGFENILQKFAKSCSIIYDFEYFLDDDNKRLISFGFYAGIVGCVLGLLQYLEKKQFGNNIQNLNYWNTKADMLRQINPNLLQNVKIAIVGAKGNCGMGVVNILDELKINYDIFYKESNKLLLKHYDIVYNCIVLNEDSKEIWFSKDTDFNKHIIITDISCDYSKENNPIQIYNENTTWDNPVYSYNKNVDIIAVNNLPSLLPKESSTYFSNKCLELLSQYQHDEYDYWIKNEKVFYDKVYSIKDDEK